MNRNNSLKQRYLYKLSANLVGLALSLVTQAIIPRGLGPKAYGDFHFLTGFFTNIQGALDMGTSSCFFTKLSQRPKDTGLVVFYAYVVGFIVLGIMLFVVGAQVSSFSTRLWPGQAMVYVYLAAFLVVLTWVSGLATQMSDAYGLTIASERVRMLQKLLGFAVLVILYVTNELHLTEFFLYGYLVLFFLIGGSARIIFRTGLFREERRTLTRGDVKPYGREFYHYSHPLFAAAVTCNMGFILDRWWLQVFGGSEQQGFYGFAYLIGTAYMLFSNAMQPLLMREFAITHATKDYQQMTAIFRRYVPSFYSLAAFFSCFGAVQADRLIYLMGGEKFVGAKAAVMIMAFFPIHQSYGQLSGSLLLATDQTSLMRNIAVATAIIGVPISYFLVAPAGRMGLGLGAAGLAVKMVLMQFIIVNVQLYFNTKMLNLKFYRYVGHQLVIVGCLLALAIGASFSTDFFLENSGRQIVSFVLAGIFYTAFCVGMGFLFPRVFGLNRSDVSLVMNGLRQRVGW